MAGCAGAALPRPGPPVVARARPHRLELPRVDPYAEPPRFVPRPAPVAFEEQALADHRALVGPGAALELSVVLERGRCYAVAVSSPRVMQAILLDENDHLVAQARRTRARLGAPAFCPRWTGSFVLSVRAARELAEVAVRLLRVALPSQ